MNHAIKIILFVAELPFLVSAPSELDSLFLQKKYGRHFSKKIVKPVCYITIETQKARSYKKLGKNRYSLSLSDLAKDFLYFNEIFHLIAMDEIISHNGFMFHGSSVVKDKVGYIFVGPEGAGKTTVISLLAPHVSLGDDTAIVRKIGKKFFLFGSPFYQRTNCIYSRRIVPVGSIFRLNQSHCAMVLAVTQKIALSLVLENVKIASRDRFLAGLLYRLCFNFVNEVGVFDLYFPKNKSVSSLVFAVPHKLKNAKASLVFANVSIRKAFSSVDWRPGLISVEGLSRAKIINESSWQFEFDGERRVSSLAQKIFEEKKYTPHSILIRRFVQKSPNTAYPLLLARQDHDLIILDGNHRAVVLAHKKFRRVVFPILLTEINGQSQVPFL